MNIILLKIVARVLFNSPILFIFCLLTLFSCKAQNDGVIVTTVADGANLNVGGIGSCIAKQDTVANNEDDLMFFEGIDQFAKWFEFFSRDIFKCN